MIQDEHDQLIRSSGSDIISCTMTSVDTDGSAIFEYEKFKKALFQISTLVFYEHGGVLYYPISLEFRLIDNNILYLIEELGVGSIQELFEVLKSSMLKEEKWTNDFELAIVHTVNEPKYCYKLPEQFVIGDNLTYTEIYEQQQ